MNKKELFLSKVSKVIPSASQTLSKNPGQYVIGVTPVAIKKGQGAYVWDNEGKKYLDLILALGPMVFGYANKKIDAAVKKQIALGTIYSLPSEKEYELAMLLKSVVPCAEMSRFLLGGNEATSGAIRLARQVTGRDHIAKCGYHGFQDWSICTKAGRNNGVPTTLKSLTHDFVYNDPGSLEKIFADHPNQIAAVILEPVSAEKPTDHFLEKVKEIAHRHGAVLIFDEMVTGFRWAIGGAQEYFGVVPDLACFGKAVSGGYPLSVISGKAKYMSRMDEIFVSTTFGGYLLGLVAAIETIKLMKQKKNVQRYMHNLGEYFITGFNAIASDSKLPISLTGYGPHPLLKIAIADDYTARVLKSYLYQEFHQRGILFSSSMMIGYIHTKKQIDEVLSVFKKIARSLEGISDFKSLERKLKGQVAAPRAVR